MANRRARCTAPALGLLILCFGAPLPALEQETQTWTTARVHLPLGDHLEGAVRYRTRFSGLFDERRLYQYQATVGHRASQHLRFDAGYERFRSRRGTVEHRYFPQLQINHTWADVPLRHRLRLELRDIAVRSSLAYRVRYLLAHRRPLPGPGRYLELRNEVFASLSESPAAPGLERGIVQNRIGVTLGQRIGERTRLEFRYQWGYVDSSLIERGDHLIQFQWTWDGR